MNIMNEIKEINKNENKNRLLSIQECHAIYHLINFNRYSNNEILQMYNITSEILDDILKAKNDYAFLAKPKKPLQLDSTLGIREVTVRINKNKYTMMNNSDEYKDYLTKHRINCPMVPYVRFTEEQLKKLKDNYKEKLYAFNIMHLYK